MNAPAAEQQDTPDPTPQSTRMLVALNVLRGQNIYAGTANPRVVAKRRAKNKVAKLSRKRNRS